MSMNWKSNLSLDFILGSKENQSKADGYLYALGSYTKTSTKTGRENMRNHKFKRDCGRARYAQGSPKGGPRATFAQKNLEQPPCASGGPPWIFILAAVDVWVERKVEEGRNSTRECWGNVGRCEKRLKELLDVNVNNGACLGAFNVIWQLHCSKLCKTREDVVQNAEHPILLHEGLQYTLEWGPTIQPSQVSVCMNMSALGDIDPLQECGRFKVDNMTQCKDLGILTYPAWAREAVKTGQPSSLDHPTSRWCVFPKESKDSCSPHLCVGFLVWFCIPLLCRRLLLRRLLSLSHTTCSHTTLSHTLFHIQLAHTQLCHTQLCPLSLSHTTCSHTTLSHTTLSHTHNFVAHNLLAHSHTTLPHTHNLFTHNFVTHTHNFVTHTTLSHNLLTDTATQLCHSHTTCSHTHTQLCHTPPFTHNFVTFNGITQLSHTHNLLINLRFARQAWHLLTSTFVLRGTRGTYETGLDLVARLGPVSRPWRRGTLRGRRGTCSHQL